MEDNTVEELYEKLVYAIARKYSYNDNDLEDLYQVGQIGLTKAKQNYKSDSNAKFSSYAHFYIKGEILKYIRENRLVRVNPELAKLSKSIIRLKEHLAQQLMREPTIEEISFYLEVDVNTIENALNSTLAVKSLDYELNGDDEGKDVTLYDYESYIEKGYDEDVLMLKDELEKLPEDERRLIISRYYEDKSQTETSKELGISQVQVSRYETKILRKIRNNIERGIAA
ncbi:MAG: sigma-70 family RNA polymerase sigma factor [Bacilli bacterium]|nr:sigma-70 family RNA polymerase sigma factor [Bacilli bacterium]